MIAPAAVDLICGFEGYHKQLADGRAAPYLCPAYVPTIGYGSIWRADGSRVAIDDLPITRDEAMALMRRELDAKCVPGVARQITTPLHPLATGALVSFVYNLGEGALKTSNLRRAINDRCWDAIPAEFAKWRMAGGRVLAGLARRRAAETDMFIAGLTAGGMLSAAVPGATARVDLWTATIKRAA